jgi:hypothetical protein
LAQAIYNELVAVLGPDAIGSSLATNYLCQRHFPYTLRETPDEPTATMIDIAIPDALEKQPFSSIRELAQLTCIPQSTVHQHLTQSLGFVMKHLRWVPHSRTAVQKAQCITLSNELLGELRSIKHHRWQFIITLDELWFYLATDHEQTWLRPGEIPPDMARHLIQDRNIMVTIAWNPLGFSLIVALPEGRTFHAEYYRDNILAALTQLQPEDDGRKLVVHADNARAHTA